jgi:broad specificity phosphatase PhoE
VPTLYLVRHGQATAGFGAHLDPGLSDLGRHQAEAAAARLASLGPLPIYSSPLARACETAAPLAQRWRRTPIIERRVSELPSPTLDLAERARWVREVMLRRWSDLDATLQVWRSALVACVSDFEEDCVVFSHFIAINAVVGAATRDDRVVIFRPDYASVTEVASRAAGRLELVALGPEADTEVR